MAKIHSESISVEMTKIITSKFNYTAGDNFNGKESKSVSLPVCVYLWTFYYHFILVIIEEKLRARHTCSQNINFTFFNLMFLAFLTSSDAELFKGHFRADDKKEMEFYTRRCAREGLF